ncbi:sensor histidine kinase [Shimazuella kribbensis]|uniref:sensor histidine kinase n=1 Tax=Shimazuella kribbensis TaxID=139808 RepID=UPI0003F66053|nr:sensor histidine kinase [Shimazuella kribbensis]
MIFVYIALILFLVCSNIYFLFSKRKQSQDLVYIREKLTAILQGETTENIQVFTNDWETQKLLIVLNRLLAQKNKTTLTYTQLEQSIRRMHTNMSHDLKTPLTVILGLSEALTVNPNISEEEQNRLVGKIHEKAQHILDLMNKFFDLAKLESGDLDLALSKIQLNEVCKNNILFFYEQVTDKGLEVKIEIPDTPVYVNSNVTALNRILHNLISNAIRYGADGQVIGVNLRYDDHHAWIDVWDQGKGIKERAQKLIFERLYTLEDSRNQLYQGSGLGLTITKRLAENIKAQISVSSKPFEKTIFTIQFDRIPTVS